MADFYKSITGEDNSISVETAAPYLFSKEYREGIRGADPDLVAQCLQMTTKIIQDQTGNKNVSSTTIWQYMMGAKSSLPDNVTSTYSFVEVNSASDIQAGDILMYGYKTNKNRPSHSQKALYNDVVNRRVLIAEYAGDLGKRITKPEDIVNTRKLWLVDKSGNLYQAEDGQSGDLTKSRLTHGDFVVGTNDVYSTEAVVHWVSYDTLKNYYENGARSSFAIRPKWNSENEKNVVTSWEKAAGEVYMSRYADENKESQVKFISDAEQAQQYLIDRMAAAESVKPKMREYDKAIAAREKHSDIDTILADKSTSYDTKKRIILMLNIRKLK